jgi:hypothetical protein
MSRIPESAANDTDGACGDLRTLPTSLAAMATGVTEATVRKWVSRGKLTRYGSPGRAEYDIEELLRLAARRSSHGQAGSAEAASSPQDPGSVAVEAGTGSESNQQSVHPDPDGAR